MNILYVGQSTMGYKVEDEVNKKARELEKNGNEILDIEIKVIVVKDKPTFCGFIKYRKIEYYL